VNCQTFFRDYYGENGPGPEGSIDIAMENYCKAKYCSNSSSSCSDGFNALFNSNAPQPDIEVCGCHMPEQLYINYANQVSELYPGFGEYIKNSGTDQKCLLAQCADSNYGTTKTGRSCPIPACIAISVFTNDGKFEKSTINDKTICNNINKTGTTRSGQTTGPPAQASWWERNSRWLVPVLVGVALLILIVIIILIFTMGKGGDKKKKPPKKEDLPIGSPFQELPVNVPE